MSLADLPPAYAEVADRAGYAESAWPEHGHEWDYGGTCTKCGHHILRAERRCPEA